MDFNHLLRLNIYELTATVIFLTAYFIIRVLNRSLKRPISYLAVFSAMNVALNPSLIHFVFLHLRSRYAVVRGDEELRSFVAGFIAMATGIIAFIRILRSKQTTQGLPFATAGIIGGSLWAGFWIQLYLRFVWAMAHWKG